MVPESQSTAVDAGNPAAGVSHDHDYRASLQRGNALRHRSASRRVFRIGRGASRTACDAERRTIVTL
ncbi:DUF1534 domain-containing protein [Pseudomonas syringae pv. maculicola]|nr:DUF1534 domain-containing protein [Pseudomonas syringae pv. maculicola]